MTPVNVMSGTLGDIFWDLAPWITYEPGYDLGCSIYVANPGDAEKEYTLIGQTVPKRGSAERRGAAGLRLHLVQGRPRRLRQVKRSFALR